MRSSVANCKWGTGAAHVVASAGAVLLALALAACASTGVVAQDDGSYSLSKKSGQIAVGPPVELEQEVYREARSFCSGKHQQMQTLNMDLVDSKLFTAGSATLQFRCI
jgi:hypothetical protein